MPARPLPATCRPFAGLFASEEAGANAVVDAVRSCPVWHARAAELQCTAVHCMSEGMSRRGHEAWVHTDAMPNSTLYANVNASASAILAEPASG